MIGAVPIAPSYAAVALVGCVATLLHAGICGRRVSGGSAMTGKQYDPENAENDAEKQDQEAIQEGNAASHTDHTGPSQHNLEGATDAKDDEGTQADTNAETPDQEAIIQEGNAASHTAPVHAATYPEGATDAKDDEGNETKEAGKTQADTNAENAVQDPAAIAYIVDGSQNGIIGDIPLVSNVAEVSLVSTQSNVVLGASGNSNAVVISGSNVTINAQLNVLGDLNTVTTTNLRVDDKVLVVAAGSDSGALSSGAGIVLSDPTEVGTPAERSLVWSLGAVGSYDSSNTTGPGGTSNGASWTFRGGALTLASYVAAGTGGYGNPAMQPARDVRFGLRVNQLDELEVFRTVQAVGAASTSVKRVAAFGGSTGNGVVLPTSTARW
ncbi:hypothetical protein CEUSTIGMA_g11928.t1 [Chlamydomonas eustigma]|uniref:Uncharacterized protein n=1 Tax=Chlamydomonas eustigma TaxID=1157962 RepID=A0A250XN67_9CHLO|nr:hypothetical protein CEUSTIGMA_g11928.t1 [Chlamydomonas eustigma]|eukprot:GAX84508.1 hypothetical protein CEUSTIGMA_g11928.t1 [Chlamydomonas eustigma]